MRQHRPPLPGAFWRGMATLALFYVLVAAVTAAVIFGVADGSVR